ncbi:NUDIX domain-containing protein [Cellulomonas cellasea]|uniref:NUDIX hydrolase n=1 Tax=Cellulomonas cellasea TaxID=43670 RepID=UPI0025A42A25|nr:NUDIX domain-containing protein [Cellulomonas cellasea]MDM8084398.1 NUDIX domain-containing protein [Cellulomonas cellasea]
MTETRTLNDPSLLDHPTLIVAAVCFQDADGRILTVRKRGTSHFMLPGKLEPGEAPDEAARREIHEEIGIRLDPADLTLLGTWRTDAANEPDTDLVGTVYVAPLRDEPAAAAEIAELRWVRIVDGDADDGSPLAPLLRERVVPALASLA